MATVARPLRRSNTPPPMASPWPKRRPHRDVMLDQIVTLKAHFADEPHVYVSGNMMMYYVEGNADKSVPLPTSS